MKQPAGLSRTPKSLKWRYFRQFALAALVTMLLFSVLFYYYMQQQVSSTFKRNSHLTVERYEERLNRFIGDELERLLIYHELLAEDAKAKIVSELSNDSRYLDTCILDAQGTVIYACEPLKRGYNYAGKAAYRQALHASEPFALVRFHHTERRLHIDMVIPAYEDTGNLQYVALHRLNPAWLAKNLSFEHYAGEGEIILFNEDGIIFLHINGQASPGGDDGHAAAGHQSLLDFGFTLDTLQHLGTAPRTFTDENYLVTYNKLEGDHGFIANRISLDIIGEHYRRFFPMLGLGTGLGLIFFLLLGIFLAKRTMAPIHELSAQVEETLQGSRNNVEMATPSELTLLAASFNRAWQQNLQTQQEIKDLADDYERVFNGTQDAMFLVEVGATGEFRFLRNNLAHQQKTGLKLTEIRGKTPAELLGPELGSQVAANYQRCVAEEAPLSYEESLELPAGRRMWLTTLTPVSREGRVKYIVGSSQDITERKRAAEALRLSEERYRQLVENVAEGIFVIQDGTIKFANPTACRLLGLPAEAIIAKPLLQFVHHEDRNFVAVKGETMLTGVNKQEKFPVRIIDSDGEVKWLEISVVTIDWEDRPAFLAFASDITERRQAQKKLEYLSLHDALTGLYNRAFFDEEMNRLDGSREYPVTVIAADLDGLKLVNDTMGHAAGDELITACANVLKESLRNSDILARVGGDEFAVLLPNTDSSTGDIIARRIRAQTDEYNRKDTRLPLSISLGIATASANTSSLEEVYKKADDRMYKNKLERRDVAQSQAVDILLTTLQAKDSTFPDHTLIVCRHCLELGERLKLPLSQLIDLALLAQVYKLGLVGIPEDVLQKKAPLTEEERALIRQHPEKGHRIALSSPDLAELANLILKQQAWWDGSGYPQGLSGTDIPVQCRILAIASAYTALTGSRPYRAAQSEAAARQELQRCAGTQFDPELVSLFLA